MQNGILSRNSPDNIIQASRGFNFQLNKNIFHASRKETILTAQQGKLCQRMGSNTGKIIVGLFEFKSGTADLISIRLICDICHSPGIFCCLLLFGNLSLKDIKPNNMDSVHHYNVNIKWENDRKGQLTSPVLDSTIEVATPPEFSHGMTGIWSPEHLLVAAVNSCLMTTFLAIAENSKLNFIHFESHADGKLVKVDGKFMISEIELKPVLTIHEESERGKAIRVLEKSESACLISNSIKAKIIFLPEVKILSVVPSVV